MRYARSAVLHKRRLRHLPPRLDLGRGGLAHYLSPARTQSRRLRRTAALSLYFYDGAECLRQLDAHKKAVDRPRGYSCEELGGLAYGFDRDFPNLHRLSRLEPLQPQALLDGFHFISKGLPFIA